MLNFVAILDDPAVKTALLTGLVQLVAVAIGFCLYFIYNRLTKRDLLYHRKDITEGMIKDKEIDIERFWIQIREAEAKKEEMEATIKKNEEEIAAEKLKTPIDVEKMKTLRIENEKIGFTGKYKDGKPEWDPKGKIVLVNNETENYCQQITQAAMEREYLKVHYRAILQLIKKGYTKDFEKFEREELYKRIVLPK